MRTIITVADLKKYIRGEKRNGKTIGFVPTMGALHEGHGSLISRSVKDNNRTIVSVFVNPTQFGPGEDFKKYPRPLEKDAEACAKLRASALFVPSVEEMYPEGFATHVEVEGLTKGLCGASRSGHFRGVTTVCAKLFNLAEPDRAYFGEKDYQQLAVVRRMVKDLNMDIEIVACPTVREPDGLAMSSRNQYLDEERRRHAAVLYQALCEAKRLVEQEGVTRTADITRAVRTIVKTAPTAKIDYVAIVDPETLEPLKEIACSAQIAMAVFINRTRLIDNMRVETKERR